MHNLGGMARLLLNGESRLLTLCTVNGLGVAEKSLVTTPARDARSRPSASVTDLQKGAPASSLGCVEVLLVAIIVDPTAPGLFVRSIACRRQERLLALPLQQQFQCRASGFVQSPTRVSSSADWYKKGPCHLAETLLRFSYSSALSGSQMNFSQMKDERLLTFYENVRQQVALDGTSRYRFCW
jgi:hypothetical protein